MNKSNYVLYNILYSTVINNFGVKNTEFLTVIIITYEIAFADRRNLIFLNF